MTVEALAENCPSFTRVVLCVTAGREEAFRWADPGDAVMLFEHANGAPTGARITALVLERVPAVHAAQVTKTSPR